MSSKSADPKYANEKWITSNERAKVLLNTSKKMIPMTVKKRLVTLYQTFPEKKIRQDKNKRPVVYHIFLKK